MLAVLAVLTGCAAISTPVSPSPTGVSPAPVPTTSTPTELAPGVTNEGVVDPAALADAHASALRNRSFTMTVERTILNANGTVRSRLIATMALSRDRRYHMHVRVGGPDFSEYEWPPPRGEVRTWRYWMNFYLFGNSIEGELRDLFSEIGGPRAQTVSRSGGRTIVRATTQTKAAGTGKSSRIVGFRSVIDGQGIVRRLTYSRVNATTNGVVRSVHAIRFTRIGTTSVGDSGWEFTRLPEIGRAHV